MEAGICPSASYIVHVYVIRSVLIEISYGRRMSHESIGSKGKGWGRVAVYLIVELFL